MRVVNCLVAAGIVVASAGELAGQGGRSVGARPVAPAQPAPASTGLAGLRQKAAAGDAQAQYTLARRLVYGDGIARDDAAGFAWAERAASQGVAAAQLLAGQLCLDGRGTAKSNERGFAWVEKAADQNLAAAQLQLGGLYAIGRGVTADGQRALLWFRKAEAQGLAVAAVYIAEIYRDSVAGVPEDQVQASAWFRKAAEAGEREGQVELARRLDDGVGVAANHAEALLWLSRAAAGGHERALSSLEKLGFALDGPAAFALGELHRDGRGVAKDAAKTVFWFRRAIALRQSQARDALEAMAKNGSGHAQFGLAEELVGAGEAEQALAWGRRAADGGLPAAQDWLADAYARRTPFWNDHPLLPLDHRQAFAWYRKAAEQGSVPAQFNVATAYEEGRGVVADAAQALVWLRKAGEGGHADAAYRLGRLASARSAKGIADPDAVRWYREAASGRSRTGVQIMARLLLDGVDGRTDLAAVRTLLRQGGRPEAQPAQTKNVTPAYPAAAYATRVQGVVVVEALVGPSGRVLEAWVLRSIPQLDTAALDAVKQWEFAPTMVDGTGVPVLSIASVNFSLR